MFVIFWFKEVFLARVAMSFSSVLLEVDSSWILYLETEDFKAMDFFLEVSHFLAHKFGGVQLGLLLSYSRDPYAPQ